ncbi:retrotransposon protein, putative, ty1-copia subclass [Tanacetum coccineum]
MGYGMSSWMALPVQNINHSAFRSMFEKEKLSGNNFNEWFARLKPVAEPNVVDQWTALYDAHTEIACLMLGSMTPELHRQFELHYPYDMIQELRSMFEKQAGVEKFDLIQSFHACKQEEGKPVADYVLKMKGYVEKPERLGYVLPQDISIGLILNGLTKDFVGYVKLQYVNMGRKLVKKFHVNAIEYDKGKGKDKKVHWKRNWTCLSSELLKKKSKFGFCQFLQRFFQFSRLVDNGFVQCFTNYGISISKNNVLYFNAIHSNAIYEIDMHDLVPNDNSIYNVSTKRAKHNLNSTYLWHCRLAHISKKRIEKLQQEGLLKSTDDESFNQCVSCLSGKMTRKSFPHRPERATDLLGIIHTDVCGPLRHVSRQGASYFITFTDDYSRYGYVYLLKHKHEVFETFKVFKNEVENQLGKTIKAIRSDRGGEYISQEFKDYLKANRIIQQLTPPYTLQHNRVSERRNHTFLDMVQSMMNLTTLPLSFWDYALESATCILNMVPTKKVDKTPYELWYGKVSNLAYLKVWGCEALMKRDTPNKLKQRSVNRRAVDLEEIQEKEDTTPSEITSNIPQEVEGFEPPQPSQEEVILIRRSERTHRAPNRLCLNVEVEEHSLGDLAKPASYKAAMLDSESNKWIDVMNAKIQSMMDNMVWVLVDLPPGCKTIKIKWLFKKKTDMDGIVHVYKACFVAKGYTQLYEVDYEETFSPVADIKAIRVLISIAAYYDYEIWQMDVKTAFLNGYLDEDIYMVQPEGFVDPNHPRKASGSNVTFLILYVDDIIIMGNHIPSLQSVKNYLGKCFSMKDLGEAILKRYKLDNSKHGHIRMQERLDLNKSQGAQRPKEPISTGELHSTAVKNILKYLRNTKDMFLVYGGNPSTELRVECYCDVGFENDRDDTKSQIGYVFILNGGAVDWKSSGTDNQEKDEKQRQNDKTGLGMEKTVKDKAKSKPESQSSQKVNRKVNWSKSKSTQVNPGAKVKEI